MSSGEPLQEAQTLASPVTFKGHGVHTGEPVTVTVRPAEEGISFHRSDIKNAKCWRLGPGAASSLPGRSQIGSGTDSIQTPEHLLAALSGMGIDAALVEVAGPEIPILDGSALPFAGAIKETGRAGLGRPALLYRLADRLEVSDGKAIITAEPHNGLAVSYALQYEGFPAACGEATFEITPEIFLKEIAPTRTFVTEDEAALMVAAGLGKGASEANTLLIGRTGPLKGGSFRLPLEPVRHKILDLVGDLALLGGRLQARLSAKRSGHALNHRMLEKIAMFAAPHQAWDGTSGEMDINSIEHLLPHRYPFLLVDRVIESDGDERLVAIKNVTRNEHFFEGHFPGHAVMPGVLQIEAMAQAAGVLLMRHHPDPDTMTAAIVGMEHVRFRRAVEPGDQLVITVTKEKLSSRLCVVRGVGTVNGEVACEARLLFSVMPRKSANRRE